MREEIDAKYHKAIQAVDFLAAHVGEPGQPAKRRDYGKIRPRVLSIIRKRAATVDEIATETGLSRIQIRGVLNATAIRDSVECRTDDGERRYRWIVQPAASPAQPTGEA
jgi:hypothetical protein